MPIGIRDFETMWEDNLFLSTKPRSFVSLWMRGVITFSRPRRFGKSLLVDTLKALFEGREELFQASVQL